MIECDDEERPRKFGTPFKPKPLDSVQSLEDEFGGDEDENHPPMDCRSPLKPINVSNTQ